MTHARRTIRAIVAALSTAAIVGAFSLQGGLAAAADSDPGVTAAVTGRAVEPALIALPTLPPVVTSAAVRLGLSRVASGIPSPVAIANPGDGTHRLFVAEQSGRIWIVGAGGRLATPFLDIRSKVTCCGERGLLGLAFHPAYATNGRFYVYYTGASGVLTISEFTVTADPNVAGTSERVILRISHSSHPNHNGGQLAFGRDRFLYIGTGDGGGGGDPLRSGQNRRTLLGKILRIDVDHPSGGRAYGIPSSNPYATSTVFRREIWSFGLRNPWRFSFDGTTLWIGDVGQDRYEEIDRSTTSNGRGKGANYGWSVMEGNHCFRPASGCNTTGKVRPLTSYAHGANGCSVTGGYVYRGTRYPVLRGLYLFGDFCSGRIWRVVAAGATHQNPVLLRDTSLRISAFGLDDTGELYVADYATGRIYRVTGA